MAAPISPAYAEFRSAFLGGDVRIGYEWQDAEEHAHFPQLAGVEMLEVLIGGIDMGQHMKNTSLSVIEAELREEQARAEFTSGNPQGQLVQPEEVADTVAWLCGPGASAITGQSIAVCGGELM